MKLSSDAIEVFLSVLDHGSFSAAARALGRVPSAVSMGIANLEAELDLVLFDRSGREPAPTDAARALEPQARHMLVQLRELEAHALALSQGLESRLSIAIAPELLGCDWAAQLGTLVQRYPQLDVEVLCAPQDDALRMLHEGRVQLALVFERSHFDGREGFEEVSTDTLVTVLAPSHPAYESGKAFRTDELNEYRQIVVAGRDAGPTEMRLQLSQRYWRTDNHEVAIALMQAGLGWGILPHALVRPHIAAGTLVEISLENATGIFRLWVDVVWSKQHPLGPAARMFVDLIRKGDEA
ncbi:MAG: LysR family transcriptional regulator [Moraxellaceae bacterium]|nr:LysR family transcriptional regulator [Moraxellaceae bacterium]